MNMERALFMIVMVDINAKVSEKRVGEKAGNIGINSWNRCGDTLVGLADGNNLRIMNTFFFSNDGIAPMYIKTKLTSF